MHLWPYFDNGTIEVCSQQCLKFRWWRKNKQPTTNRIVKVPQKTTKRCLIDYKYRQNKIWRKSFRNCISYWFKIDALLHCTVNGNGALVLCKGYSLLSILQVLWKLECTCLTVWYKQRFNFNHTHRYIALPYARLWL